MSRGNSDRTRAIILIVIFALALALNYIASVTNFGYNRLPDMGDCGAIIWLYVDIDNDGLEQHEVFQWVEHEDCSLSYNGNVFSG